MKPAIEINQLSKKYRIGTAQPYLALRDVITGSFKNFMNKDLVQTEFWALDEVSFKVEKGERIGIIGRNGAGKTTLLKILSRVTWPTKGEAIIRGRLASLLEVGTGFHPELTGRENIFLNGSILGLKKKEIQKQFDAIVDFSGVKTFLDTPLKNFSSGMQLRLAFAVAAHLEPEILLIDEVLAVGDLEFQKKCIQKMEEVSTQHGRTILFVSHQLNAINKLCTRAIWLEKGKLKQQGAVGEITAAYINDLGTDPSAETYQRQPGKEDFYFGEIRLAHSNIQIGDDLIILVTINEKYSHQQFVVNFNIKNEQDELVAHIINDDDRFGTGNLKSKLRITLKHLNLVPGRYKISCWAGYDMEHGIDWVDNAVSFTVGEVNTYTNRAVPFPSDSKIVVRSTWEAN